MTSATTTSASTTSASKDERAALVPRTMVLGSDGAERTSRDARAIEAWDHVSVAVWIANDVLWSQESRWTFVAMALVVGLFTRNAYAARQNANEFRHALAVMFWLVGANSVWVYQDFYGSVWYLEIWCLCCFGASIAIELVQLAKCAFRKGTADEEQSGNVEVSDAFQSVAVLSWAAHDASVFTYYNLSEVSRYYCRVSWWTMSIVIIAQVTYYLWFQMRMLYSKPDSSGADYALALFSWSIGCILWEYGDFYMPEVQDPAPVFELPKDVHNFRWIAFWIMTVGALPLLVWCVRHAIFFTTPRAKNE